MLYGGRKYLGLSPVMMANGFTRVFYDPATAVAVSTAFNVGGRLFTGFSESRDDEDRALFAEEQATEEAILRRQELDDFDKEQRARESRQNAIFACVLQLFQPPYSEQSPMDYLM